MHHRGAVDWATIKELGGSAMEENTMNRRQMLASTGLAGAGLALSASGVSAK